MITPSPEIEAVVRRWNTAIRRKDAKAIDNMLSNSEHLRYQGSAENESWSGPVFRRGFVEHNNEIPDFDFDEINLEGFQSGDVGWAHCLAYLKFGTKADRELHRFTFVLCLEDGIWRMVQLHVSNNRDNVEKMGVSHQALDRLVNAAKEGFRLDQREGLATVMFTDIIDSSAIANLLGDQLWTERVRGHFDVLSGVIDAHQGQLVKSLGDGTMSSFPSAKRALAAAMAIQTANREDSAEPPLTLRIGIHTGDVIQTEDDFFGTVVNKAARIAAQAQAGEILISDATLMMAGDSGLTVEARRDIPLKGLTGNHQIVRLAW